MTLLARVFAIGLLISCTGACAFDLTEINPAASEVQLSGELITTWGGTAALSIRLEPGFAAGGTPRMGADDSVVIRGLKHAPIEVDGGVWSYDVNVGADAGPLHVELPPLIGLAGPLTVTMPMVWIEALDTLRAEPDGVLSIGTAGHDGIPLPQRSAWRVAVLARGTAPNQPVLTMTGYGQAALHVPVMMLPPGLKEGWIDVSVSSGYRVFGTTMPYRMQLHAVGLIPFRIE